MPEEMLARARSGFAAYQNYPVFSAPWLWRRALRFALASSAVGGAVGAGLWATGGRAGAALLVALHFALGVTLISCAGPALATLVRHRRWPRRREQPMVLAALASGVLASAIADGWASSAIEQALGAPDPARAPAASGAPRSHPHGGDALALALYGALGGGWALKRYFGEHRKLEELTHEREVAALQARRRELDVRMTVLQAQVEPHFLFNTLASAHSLIATDPAAAQRLLDALIRYLRATIPRLRAGAQVDATLGQQVELCESYLQVMRARMGERLRARTDVPPDLREAAFPPLLLLSLVENAIKHGLEPKVGSGEVAMVARREGDRLSVSVVDDGVGLREGLGGGTGLQNVREWLQARYGERAAFRLTGGRGGGAEATVLVPLEWSAPSRG